METKKQNENEDIPYRNEKTERSFFFRAEKTNTFVQDFRLAEKNQLCFSFCVDGDRFDFRTPSPFKRSGVTVRSVNNLFFV